MKKVKVFIDFWDLQLSWNDNVSPEDEGQNHVRLNWRVLPDVLIEELPDLLGGDEDDYQHKGSHVYASVNPNPESRDAGLRRFLEGVLDRMPGFNVNILLRRNKIEVCPNCGEERERGIEKGVSLALVNDLFAGAVNGTYDIALLISNDSSLIPSISLIQEHLDRIIIHVSFDQLGAAVRSCAWNHLIMDGDLADMIRLN